MIILINKYLKKIVIILFFISLFTNSYSKNYYTNQKIENSFELSPKVIFNLPDGKWTLYDKWSWYYGNISIKTFALLKVSQNKVSDIMIIDELNTGSQYIGYLSQWIEEIFFKDKYDGCYERPEYYYLKVYKKGMSFNCLVVSHIDIQKELYNPDDPHDLGPVKLRNWLSNNKNIDIADTFLIRQHYYYSTRTNKVAYRLQYTFDPLLKAGPETNYGDEKQSEYHKSNINNYPNVKKYMEKWVQISCLEHNNFENTVRARKEHKFQCEANNISFNHDKDDNLVDKILELKKLLDEGIITNEEFTKMKKRILN